MFLLYPCCSVWQSHCENIRNPSLKNGKKKATQNGAGQNKKLAPRNSVFIAFYSRKLSPAGLCWWLMHMIHVHDQRSGFKIKKRALQAAAKSAFAHFCMRPFFLEILLASLQHVRVLEGRQRWARRSKNHEVAEH